MTKRQLQHRNMHTAHVCKASCMGHGVKTGDRVHESEGLIAIRGSPLNTRKVCTGVRDCHTVMWIILLTHSAVRKIPAASEAACPSRSR